MKRHSMYCWVIPCIVVMILALNPVSTAGGSSFIGIYDGNPFIYFGDTDPAGPPVVVAGGTQLLILACQDTWTLSIEAKGDLASTKDPKVTIPASRLAWAVYDGTSPRWTPLRAKTPQIILGQAAPTGENGRAVRIDYRFSPSWDDLPMVGSYSTDLGFTLSPDLDPMQSWVHPTPFWPDGVDVLTIGYWLPGSGPEQVEVVITDTRGGVVRRMRATQLGGQWHEVLWDGLNLNGNLTPPGTYHYQVILLSTGQPIAAGIVEVVGNQYAGKSTIHGQVIRGDTGEGLAGAHVVLYTGERRKQAACQSGRDGTYQLTFIPAGEYYLEASLPGYVPSTTDIFVLDGYEEREIPFELLPNRALDIDLQLDSKTVAVGDLLRVSLRITNSGTRDLLGVVGEVGLPMGFTLVERPEHKGRVYTKPEAKRQGNRVFWEVGPLRQGESSKIELWLLVGLDTPTNGALIRAQATGYGTTKKVATQVVSRPVEVTPGPFMATTPRSLVDSHLIFPLSPDVAMELRIKPDKAMATPGLPFQGPNAEKYIERSPLVPIAEPTQLTLGSLPSHRLRMRLEGSSWAIEGGSWRHSLPQSRQPLQEIQIVGIQGARRLGALTLRGVYGTPKAWPTYRLYPANNTSGPFQLPAPFPLTDSVNVQIISWDPIQGIWQDEAPVLFRVDYAKGAVTLGRAVSVYNSQGHRQHILVTYSQEPKGKDVVWKEIEAVLEQPGWEIAASFLEAGSSGELKIAGLRSHIIAREFHLKGSLQTILKSRINPKLESNLASLSSDDVQSTVSSSLRDSSSWQLIAAVEIYPGIRIGGGWGLEGAKYSGLWGITTKAAGKGTVQGQPALGQLVLDIEKQLAVVLPSMQAEKGILSETNRESGAKALGLELDLVGGWTTSLLIHQKELVERRPMTTKSLTGESTEGWEQRLDFAGVGLPRWSLGYGQVITNHPPYKSKHHYGLMEVQGKIQALKWNAKLSLAEEISDSTGQVKSPIKAMAEISMAYEEGKIRPYINARQQGVAMGKSGESGGGFEEWTLGINSQLTDGLEVSLAHLSKKGLNHVTAGSEKNDIIKQGSSGTETVSVSASYALWENWTLKGQSEWTTFKGRQGPSWQGGIELQGNLDRDIAFGLGWERSQRLDTEGARQWVDTLSFDVNQRCPGNTCHEKKLYLGTSLWDGRLSSLELAGEALLKPHESWEIWGYGATKMAKPHWKDNIYTHQGILRLARRLRSKLAGFVQIGGWQQMQRHEVGCSLGFSFELTQGLHFAAGYTWPLHRRESQGGLLSVKPGVFVQLFAY